LPLRPIRPRHTWLPVIDQFLSVRRWPPYPSGPWKCGPWVTWIQKNNCQLLGAALDLVIDDSIGVAVPACPAEYVPSLIDETGLPADHIPSIDLRRKKIPKHKEFTENVTRVLKSSWGLTCIITDGLDGFSGSYPRLKRFLQQLKFPVCFIHIFAPTTTSPMSLTGPGFPSGTLADGRYYTFFLSDELCATPCSPKVEMLIAAFNKSLETNHAPVKTKASLRLR
jgi:hypothetical protein